MRNFGILALSLAWAVGAPGADLPDLTGLSVRGSYAFTEPQLALELNRVMAANEVNPNLRSSGFVTCRTHGRGIGGWVDCTLKTTLKGSPYLGGHISLESTAPKILRVVVSDPELFLHTVQTSEQISCTKKATANGSEQQICDLRLE